jgi:hypothetical protein
MFLVICLRATSYRTFFSLEAGGCFRRGCFMTEYNDYSVRVQLLRETKYGYNRLQREMNRKGFRQMYKGISGSWVQLPKGMFHISTPQTFDMVKRTATELATAIDPTALVRTDQGVNWSR